MTSAARSSRTSRRKSTARYTIHIAGADSASPISAARLRKIARATLAAEDVSAATVSIALVNNTAINDLNRRHLHHDYPTDVLSFLFESISDRQNGKSPRKRVRSIDGEIVISVEMAQQCGPAFGSSAADELALYLVHGLLHLCHYDDRTTLERRRMRRREGEILASVGIRVTKKPLHKRDSV
jgi:probable rRNA maturation factor